MDAKAQRIQNPPGLDKRLYPLKDAARYLGRGPGKVRRRRIGVHTIGIPATT